MLFSTMLRPIISIDKIILGYRIANQAKYEINEIVEKLTADFTTKPEIIDSNLKAQF
jgi:hypothetical protein